MREFAPGLADGATAAAVLKQMSQACPGARAALVMQADGTLIHAVDSRGEGSELDAICRELASLTGEIHSAARVLRFGALDAIEIQSADLVMVVRKVGAERYVAMVLASEGLVAKARFLVRVAARRLEGSG